MCVNSHNYLLRYHIVQISMLMIGLSECAGD